MKVSVLSVFPHLYKDFLKTSLIGRSQEKGTVSFDVAGFSDFCKPKERLDAPTVGHGSGMAIRPEVVQRAVDGLEAKHGKAYRIFLTPQGKKLDQDKVKQLATVFDQEEHVMLVAGRYEGIDSRAQEQYADLEVSIGDYILMGGDLPVMVLLESVLRYVPGVVGKAESVEKDSFSGPFVDFPTYTTPPREWEGKAVPEILLSGNHAEIEEWRQEVSASWSVREHFAWLRSHCKQKEDRQRAARHIPPHYAALLHDEVIIQQGEVGTSSVTSLDVHDIARSGKTYGIKEYFMVTPLEDQQKIVGKILDFWKEAGIDYNKQRHEAVKIVSLAHSLDQVVKEIEKKEGKKPLVVGTSARSVGHAELISYKDQAKVWSEERPVLFVFGTAKGLAPQVLERCDYLLLPIEGFSDFNHLSVRSAIAIIYDRWLGINLD
jgi:tRNA (guanine37-N1)-methyltransferase